MRCSSNRIVSYSCNFILNFVKLFAFVIVAFVVSNNVAKKIEKSMKWILILKWWLCWFSQCVRSVHESKCVYCARVRKKCVFVFFRFVDRVNVDFVVFDATIEKKKSTKIVLRAQIRFIKICRRTQQWLNDELKKSSNRSMKSFLIDFDVRLTSINNTLRLLMNVKRVDVELKFMNYENFSIEKKKKRKKKKWNNEENNRLNCDDHFERCSFKSNKS